MAPGNNPHHSTKPTREDGRPWTNTMESAAQLRAQGLNWPAIAEKLGLSVNTVQQYPSQYPPFETKDDRNPGLVEYYRERLLDARFKEHWGAGEIAALEAVRKEFENKSRQAEAVADRLDEGDYEDKDEREALQSKLSTLSRAVVSAAREYNHMTGRTAYRTEQGKLRAQEDVHGTPGERVHHRVSLDDLDDMDAADLSKHYQQLREGETES